MFKCIVLIFTFPLYAPVHFVLHSCNTRAEEKSHFERFVLIRRKCFAFCNTFLYLHITLLVFVSVVVLPTFIVVGPVVVFFPLSCARAVVDSLVEVNMEDWRCTFETAQTILHCPLVVLQFPYLKSAVM